MTKTQKRTVAYVGVLILLLADILSTTAQSSPGVDVTTFRPLIQECLDTVIELISMREEEQLNGTNNRPFVTLSYAQSLDGKIALIVDSPDGESATSSNLPISGAESLYLTHALRSQHDAILIGGKTWAIDNPRLNNRLWDLNRISTQQQPRPVVLDPDLRYLAELGDTIRAENLIVCCSNEAANKLQAIPHSVTLLQCPLNADRRLDLVYVLFQLRHRYGIRSVMVEGGASVLTTFANEGLVDFQCVTIAPKLLGARGLPSIGNLRTKSPHHETVRLSLGPLRCFNLGQDCIVLTRWQ